MANKRDELYKYTKLEFINSTINNGIFASSVDTLNDPYECQYITVPSDYKIICLSRSRNQKLMWSHYANGHRGCSIKIEHPDNYDADNCILKRVEYTSKLITYNTNNPEEIVENLYKKDKKWENEKEVRAVLCLNDFSKDIWKKYRNNYFYKAKITQIDFGCFSHFDPHYLDALISIRDYNTNHKKKIKVRKYTMSERRYEFIIDKNFDYIKEIADILNSDENQ